MRVVDRLISAGLSETEAAKKQELFAELDRVVAGPEEVRRWFVPGRIEVLGKHTDYAGGRSLLCATERGMCVSAKPRRDMLVRVTDIRRGESLELPFSAGITPSAGWGNYVGTVVRRLARNFPGISRGADIAIASDLPSAAGLSSSSVLVVAIFTALAEVNGLRECERFQNELGADERLAEYLGCIENGQSYGTLAGDTGVGTFGGSEDHTAILCSQPGTLAVYSFCPVTLECRVPLPEGYTFIVGVSGVRASKTGAAKDLYNRASRAAAAVLESWRAASEQNGLTLGDVMRNVPNGADQIRDALNRPSSREFSAEELQSRFKQFVLESEEIIPAAVAALNRADFSRFGQLVDQSQAAAEQLLRNQVPETVSLARSARRLGAVAASAFGAGFGGSVWALVNKAEASRFIRDWRATYGADFGRTATTSDYFVTRPGPGLIAI